MLSQGNLLRNVLIMNMDMQLEDISVSKYNKNISELNAEELYIVVVCMVKGLVDTFIKNVGEKKFYFISNAFEKGSFLENNLFNLGIYEILEGVLVSKGQEISKLKEAEEEYVGSANSFEQTSKTFFEESKRYGLTAEAMGVRRIKTFQEMESYVDDYCKEKSWLVRQDVSNTIMFNDVRANVLFYSMDVVGKDKEIYKFRLFDLEMKDDIAEEEQQIYYDYFLVNSSVKEILKDLRKNQYDLRKMDSYVRIGMEGKYIAFVIPELLRIMVNEKAIPVEEAVEVVKKTCGFENYSMMIEEINKCPMPYVEKLVPRLIEKIKETEERKRKVQN